MKSKLLAYRLLIFILFAENLGANSQAITQFTNRNKSQYDHLLYESNIGDSIIRFDGYAVIYSYKHNLPLYTFHKLTKRQITVDDNSTIAKRSTSFRPWLLPNKKLSRSNIDYFKSGYDRGHMVPAGDFVWDKRLKDETFWYININPQMPNLNQGIWAMLENEIRNYVINESCDLFIVTGVIFSEVPQKHIGPNQLEVPASFFKIIYSPETLTAFAFLFDNTLDQFEGSLTDFQVNVDFLEQITGEDFFDLLDDNIENTIEDKVILFFKK